MDEFVVGSLFKTRFDLSRVGIHRPPMAGIWASHFKGAESIVLSGGYEDDEDLGEEIVYTGQGGMSGGKQITDQRFERGNAALGESCDIKRPIRVTRGYTLRSEFAPIEGYRYDGLYYVTKYWEETGRSGFKIWRFKLERISGQPPLPKRDYNPKKKQSNPRKKAKTELTMKDTEITTNMEQEMELKVMEPAIMERSSRDHKKREISFRFEYAHSFEDQPIAQSWMMLTRGECFICEKKLKEDCSQMIQHLIEHKQELEQLPDEKYEFFRAIQSRFILNQARIRYFYFFISSLSHFNSFKRSH